MKCSRCNEQTPDVYRYCLLCGADLLPTSAQVEYASLTGQQSLPAGRSRQWPLVLAMAMCALVIAGLIAGIYLYTRSARQAQADRDEESQSQPQQTTSSPVPTSVPHRRPTPPQTNSNSEVADVEPASTPRVPPASSSRDIPDGAIEVINRHIHISPRSYFAQEFKVTKDAHVRGTFDSSSPVEVSLLSRKGIEFFHSARINNGTVDVTIPPGVYYVLFENRFSWITGKDVRAVVYYQY